ncbi:hypothetical protein ACFX13_013605 [Malus domestica]
MLSQNFSSAAAIGSSTTSSSGTYGESKKVWVWTESKQVMTAAIKRGWNTFVFPFQSRELADEWSYLKTGEQHRDLPATARRHSYKRPQGIHTPHNAMVSTHDHSKPLLLDSDRDLPEAAYDEADKAGAIARNSLLWLLMWATAMRLLVQLLSVRLGVAIERHLAELCKEEYPTWAWMVLWVMAELKKWPTQGRTSSSKPSADADGDTKKSKR